MQKTNWYGDNCFSWNPIAMRCTPVSAGCDNCWHLRMAQRVRGNTFDLAVRDAYGPRGKPVIISEQKLQEPMRCKKPALIAVQFMGDLFHINVTDQQRDKVFAVMAEATQHTFLLSTKRPALARAYGGVGSWRENIWLGSTIELHGYSIGRIECMMNSLARHRWASVEPMLGKVNLHLSSPEGCCQGETPVEWVVVGCESGPKARPCKHEWMLDVVDQCQEERVPVYVKQVAVNGKVEKDIANFPPALQVRQLPEAFGAAGKGKL